jgi:hypothetical protein
LESPFKSLDTNAKEVDASLVLYRYSVETLFSFSYCTILSTNWSNPSVVIMPAGLPSFAAAPHTFAGAPPTLGLKDVTSFT